MKLAAVIVLGFAIVCGVQAGCSTKVCTLIGCGIPFQVSFHPPGERWAPGTYEVAVTADGSSSRCVVTLPFPSCGGPGPTCEGTRDWQVITSGCALPSEQHGIGGIAFVSATPATVEVVVTRGGRQLAAATFAPSYQTSEPNGPGCGDPCYGAPGAMLSIAP